jgi:hypothetical protein
MLTYGLSRSPMRASFQKTPMGLRSRSTGDRRRGGGGKGAPVLAGVHEGGEDVVGVSAGADAEEQAHEQRLEVEERRLGGLAWAWWGEGRTILSGGWSARQGDGGRTVVIDL